MSPAEALLLRHLPQDYAWSTTNFARTLGDSPMDIEVAIDSLRAKGLVETRLKVEREIRLKGGPPPVKAHVKARKGGVKGRPKGVPVTR